MASKNMTTIMSLYIALHLVFSGFTSAQPPVQPPVCPLTRPQLQVCVDLLGITGILNPRELNQCCTLLARVGGPSASVCLCDAARVRLLGSLADISVNVAQLLSICSLPLQSGAVTCT